MRHLMRLNNKNDEMKTKLTTTEKRALAFCESLLKYNGGTINMEWKRSAMYGHNPVIEYRGGKCTNVSGCGYDKESAALASVLCYLFPINSEPFLRVARGQGAGLSSIVTRLEENGWKLEKTASGKTFDAYQLARI